MNELDKYITPAPNGPLRVNNGKGFSHAFVDSVTAIVCDVTKRGARLTIPGVAGTADRHVVCDKNASNVYGWRETGETALDARYGVITPADNVFRVVGSSDATKKLAFEVDGFTSGQTRTVTFPDQSTTISAFGASLIDDAAASNARTTLGAVAVGGDTMTGTLTNTVSTLAGNAFIALRYGADAFGSFIKWQKTRNASAGSHTIVQSGDELGYMSWQGSDGTAFIEAARLQGFVDGTPGTNDMPGGFGMWTTPDGAATVVERVRIHNDGGLSLKDGITAPATHSGWATIYVDTADGDLKIKFGDGTVKTIVVDT